MSSGGTGHLEVVEVEYDPSKVSYKELLEVYLKNVDPFDSKGQFCDKGESYLPAIFYGSEADKKAAEELLESIPKKTK